MAQQVQAAEVEIVADLAKAKISLGDVLNLKEGDVIPIGLNETVEATIDNIPVMACTF